jgi:hypothetical protein
MGRNAGSRRMSDTGSTTGVATTILALLSAGTVATLTLVGVNQLAPTVSHPGSAKEQSLVLPPREVKVTPHSSASPSTIGGSQGQTSKPRASSPAVVAVVQMPTTPQGVARVITAVSRIHPAALTPTSVEPTGAPVTPTLRPSESPTVRVPTGRAHPSRAHGARHEPPRRAGEPTRDNRGARSRRGSSGCRQHDGGDHRVRGHGGNRDDRRRGASGQDGSGADRGQRGHGHGHGGHGGSQHDHHGH